MRFTGRPCPRPDCGEPRSATDGAGLGRLRGRGGLVPEAAGRGVPWRHAEVEGEGKGCRR